MENVAAQSPWLRKLKALHFHSKPSADVRKKSSLGGFVAVLVVALMLVLLVSEFTEWIQPRYSSTLSVDIVRNEKLSISFDMSFHRLPCDDVTIDLIEIEVARFTILFEDSGKIAVRSDTALKNVSLHQLLLTGGSSCSYPQADDPFSGAGRPSTEKHTSHGGVTFLNTAPLHPACSIATFIVSETIRTTRKPQSRKKCASDGMRVESSTIVGIDLYSPARSAR